MKTLHRVGGAVRKQPYFTLDELEQMCRRELGDVDLLPTSPEPIRIERFIEKRFGISYEYGDLGPGVLGLTVFGRSGVDRIVVSRDLDSEGTTVSNRRVRTTLAHEAGHGLLHATWFILGDQPRFISSDSDTPRVMCRDAPDAAREKSFRGPWHEFQANRAIGGLLLPRHLVLQVAKPYLESSGALKLSRLSNSNRPILAQALSEVFDVNRIVATIRLDELFEKDEAAQLSF